MGSWEPTELRKGRGFHLTLALGNMKSYSLTALVLIGLTSLAGSLADEGHDQGEPAAAAAPTHQGHSQYGSYPPRRYQKPGYGYQTPYQPPYGGYGPQPEYGYQTPYLPPYGGYGSQPGYG